MDTNRTNPLDEIEFWLLSLPPDLQVQLAKTASHYHISEESYREDSLEGFLAYLDSSELNDRQIVARTLFVTRLIDFAFTGKETQQDWEEALDRLLLLRSRIAETGGDTKLEDETIANLEDNKTMWMDTAASWRKLMEEQLSNKQLAEWYFDPLFKRKKI